MRLLMWLVFLAVWVVASAETGKFWHISDLHLDPNYTVSQDPLRVCPSAGTQMVYNPGPWGDYLCDSPWALVNSSVYAMKEIEPNPDFIFWTGDDTPHVPDEKLGEAAVLEIVERLTSLIREAFPGAFYSELLPDPSSPGRIVVLNTNLYYSNNQLTADLADPSQQFQWLDSVLTNASHAGEKVYIIGHVPPGFFEKTRKKAWFRDGFNKEYLKMVQKHHHVIAGQFFGHHHTDSFRMFYDDAGAPISAMFLAPGVSPWKTTLVGVVNGANNPGIRLFEYDRATLNLHDMRTYFLNLSQANAQDNPHWELEYRLTEAYGVPDASVRSMQAIATSIAGDQDKLQRYYVYNSVSYDTTACGETCRTEFLCATQEVDFDAYDTCLRHTNASPRLRGLLVLLALLLGLRALLAP
ncbi:acid sphingomyelinase-like phosphodiesterase 3b isoform X3 [Cavia porcellus]|uniref:acid sphingomyelinase-like phosphodiesterase 3b isoform X3 n=1 Tax=Cavia porcellus TaxID=10141 RepID=UPI000C8774B5|nr:acid sphingomyelinase-like phosphodiesterase 3b isoform X2 [Cavia porcellus]